MEVHVKCASQQEQLKYEDVIIVHENLQDLASNPGEMCKWSLYCVCDGHGGKSAAEYMVDNLGRETIKRLPTGCPPELTSPDWQIWGQKVRQAVVDTFLYLDEDFEKLGLPQSVGCTVSMALSCKHLLTVANIGDSEAFLDTGRKFIIEMTKSHKIDTNVEEQERLRKAGRQVNQLGRDMFRPVEDGEEGIGPLRVWPCGLAVSRSVGDYDCGAEVTAAPHVRQVEIPAAGARLILASDGLWDHVTAKKACKLARRHYIDDVPELLIDLAKKISKEGLTDDTTVLIVDMLPKDMEDFKEVARKLRSPASVIKRFVQNKKHNVPPKFLADYDGVDRANEKAAKPQYTRAHTDIVEANQAPSNSVDDDESAELTVIGETPRTEDGASMFPGANISRIIDPDKLEEALTA